MKRPMCDGTGKSAIGVGAFTIHGADCDQCNGKGIIEPMTNEEWFCTLSTEEKAKALNDVFWKYLNYIDEHELVDDDISEIYLRWLKEKHDGNMGRNL